jgi:hypothetical protein
VTDLPDRLPPSGLPAERRLSNRDFELVIRRAAELQARDPSEAGGDGVSESELIRIGRELGLSTQHLNQALAEVSGARPAETGLFVRVFGPGVVSASRTVPGEAAGVSRLLERYLVEREYLAVLRRFPDRIILTRAAGVAATFGRAMTSVFSRSRALDVNNLEVVVHPLEDGFAYVTVATMLTRERNAAAAGSILGGGGTAAFTGAVLSIAVAPPAALLALPLLGGAIYAGHRYYDGVLQKVQVQLESLLDRLEHGELPQPVRGWGGGTMR